MSRHINLLAPGPPSFLLFAAAAIVAVSITVPAAAQRGGGQAGPPPTARAAAPVDLTGRWVSVVTEDWRYRMMTPARGDHPGIPLTADGNRIANAWDPAKDEAAGEQCRAYGAAGVMRAPGRLRITWENDSTLKVETEAGTQTRLFRFASPAAQMLLAGGAADIPCIPAEAMTPSWQGASVAVWEGGGRGGRGAAGASPANLNAGNLKTVTTRMRPGYLLKNGVPYSASAVLTEYFHRTFEPNGDSWLIHIAVVEDPVYLAGRFFRSTHFKRLPDANTAWEPEPCSAR
ncbi:MAG: hypothetical protein A3G76_14495 [Acidobacteria bacterium RIFCSPLOWO2_12_FULL_65_11]|nr:MAG: hypothetical protein A3G76_14495 [Acidobacteria bacterium RIFCSPLOWO2_12_FULL_65_11]